MTHIFNHAVPLAVEIKQLTLTLAHIQHTVGKLMKRTYTNNIDIQLKKFFIYRNITQKVTISEFLTFFKTRLIIFEMPSLHMHVCCDTCRIVIKSSMVKKFKSCSTRLAYQFFHQATTWCPKVVVNIVSRFLAIEASVAKNLDTVPNWR